MLRIIWILPGGCALLAIVILALSFRTLDRPHSQSVPNVARTRFAVIELGEHPEWRQFLVLSADQRANELNRLREILAIRANDVASDTPIVTAQPANRNNSDLDDGNILSLQPGAAETDASAPIQAPSATTAENQVVGSQEDRPGVATLLEASRASIHEEKPTVRLEEKPVVVGEEKSTKAADTPIVAVQPANRNNSDLDESNVLSLQSRAADTGASAPIQVPIATPDGNQAVGVQEGNAQPANRNDSNLDESNALSLQSSRAAGNGASTPIQVPVATANEDHTIGIQEDKLPEDTRAPTQEGKPKGSAPKEKPVAIGSDKSTKAIPAKKSAAIKTPGVIKPRAQGPSKGVQHVGSRARAPSKQNPPSQQYFFDPFGYQQASQTSPASTTSYFADQTASTTSYFTDQQARQVPTPRANQQLGHQTPNAGNKNPPHTSKKITAPKKIVQ